jgi:dipeptidyl aminopeptidase/acylaminoacyl peptidase
MKRLIPLLILATLSCQWNSLQPNSISTVYPPEHIPTVVALTAESLASPTPQAIDTPTFVLPSPSSTLTAQPTLAPYEQYTIDYLRKRTYGSGKIEVLELMEDRGSFTRYLIRYPSDGLTIYGFANIPKNIPKGAGPFPILIVLHGYVNTAEYQTLDYTTEAADRLTEAGFIVIHPNMRNYPPSDDGDNLFRVGIAVDVLNLISLIKTRMAPPELLNAASVDQIGLWGHSLGGDIVLRVLTVSSDVKAAVLYASISGDETKNTALFSTIIYNDPQLQRESATSPLMIQHISPSNYYDSITVPVQLYHGTSDSTIPLSWAQETCDLLRNAGVTINCIFYEGEDHTFRRRVADEFYRTQLDFFHTYLSP